MRTNKQSLKIVVAEASIIIRSRVSAVLKRIPNLDTHPTDTEALAYYQYVNSLRSQAMNAYMDQYGPLTKDQERSTTDWTWVKGPWPWEGGMN